MIALCRAFVALLVFVLVAAQPSAQAQNYNYGINTHNLDAMTGGKYWTAFCTAAAQTLCW